MPPFGTGQIHIHTADGTHSMAIVGTGAVS
jgi:hypothetical protein